MDSSHSQCHMNELMLINKFLSSSIKLFTHIGIKLCVVYEIRQINIQQGFLEDIVLMVFFFIANQYIIL